MFSATPILTTTLISLLISSLAATPIRHNIHNILPRQETQTTTTTKKDPCATLLSNRFHNTTIFRAEDVLDCYNAFSVSPESKVAHINAIKSYFKFYPYIDLAKNSHAPLYQSQVDILQTLDIISQDDNISTEFALHTAIKSLISSLNDAHASYRPSCFSQFAFLQPWVVALKYSGVGGSGDVKGARVILKDTIVNGGTVFDGVRGGKAAQAVTRYWNEKNGIDPSKYVGYEIVSVNGIPAMDALQQYADQTTGISRSSDSRLNDILPSYFWSTSPSTGVPGMFMVDGTFYLLLHPHANFTSDIVYELRSDNGKSETLIIDWAAIPLKKGLMNSLVSKESYYNTFCVVDPASTRDSEMGGGGTATGASGETGGDNGAGQNQIISEENLANYLSEGYEGFQKSALGDVDVVNSLDSISFDDLNPLSQQHILGGFSRRLPWTGRDFDNYDRISQNNLLHHHIMVPQMNFKTMSQGFKSHDELLNELKVTFGKGFGGRVPSLNLLTDANGVNSNGSTSQSGSLSTVNVARPVEFDENGAFFNLDGRTGVWVFSTVMPLSPTPQGLQEWLNTIMNGLAKLKILGLTKLVIDVTNNGGGNVCMGQLIIQMLFPQHTFNWLQYDIKYSDEAYNLFATAIEPTQANSTTSTLYSHSEKTSVKDHRQIQSADDLFSPGILRLRGGVGGRYSNLFEFGECQMLLESVRSQDAEQLWDAQNISIVSNGLCGSTCAAMVRILRDQLQIRAFTYGGLTGQLPFQPTSFEGGLVATYKDLRDTKSIPLIARQYLPLAPIFPMKGTIPFWESYGNKSNNIPMEWLPHPADAHLIDIIDTTDPVSVWTSAAQLAMTMAPVGGESGSQEISGSGSTSSMVVNGGTFLDVEANALVDGFNETMEDDDIGMNFEDDSLGPINSVNTATRRSIGVRTEIWRNTRLLIELLALLCADDVESE
ncbi:hypothetical protein HDU76_013624 [Blyttiomyces sp. JEL0837]|nr:hypothetical protein HDU76_013624 [Blyttiomyces sp. JEL0837]